MSRKRTVAVLMAALAVASVIVAASAGASGEVSHDQAQAGSSDGAASPASTRTPVKHVVLIFQENVSFDHYFGTYPSAANTDGQPFAPAPGTPAVDGLPPVTSPSCRRTCGTPPTS